MPTSLVLDPSSSGWSLGKISYPPGRDVKLAFSTEVLSVYEAKTVISFPLLPAPGADPAMLQLTFQACDERACQRPETVTLVLPTAN